MKLSSTRSRKIALVMVVGGTIACLGVTSAVAEPGEVDAGGMHVVASVDSNGFVPAGGDISTGIPFVHAVKVSGNYSVALTGASALRGGEMVAGYLIGCAVDISSGISVGISPSVGINAGVAPSITLNIGTPPSVSVGVSPSIGVSAGIAGSLAVTLAPGTVTAAAIGAAGLDSDATFPYTFAHTNTPLNISGCLSPASAMPFVTVRADGTGGTAQTTGYGTEFGF